MKNQDLEEKNAAFLAEMRKKDKELASLQASFEEILQEMQESARIVEVLSQEKREFLREKQAFLEEVAELREKLEEHQEIGDKIKEIIDKRKKIAAFRLKY